jgi:hypothetical protein
MFDDKIKNKKLGKFYDTYEKVQCTGILDHK